MKPEALAVLMLAKTKAVVVKPKPKPEPVATPVANDDGKSEWTRFKSECVLLTKKGGAR